MSESDVEKLRIEIGQLDSKFKIKSQALEQASSKREAEEKGKLLKIIHDAVEKIAKKEDFDMVIDTQVMQYGKPEYDLSDKVIKALK